jgi:sec-independent protein translocase protein TatB
VSTEILFLALIALVVLGPRKLAALAPQVGKVLAQFRKATSEFTSQVGAELNTTFVEHSKPTPNNEGYDQTSGESIAGGALTEGSLSNVRG